MKLLLLATIFLLSGCTDPPVKIDWEIAPLTHKCTDEQMDKVEEETIFCIKNTTYFSSYCYGSSILRHCVLREELQNEIQTR